MAFKKDGVEVFVQQELGTPPRVELVAPVAAVPGCGRRFGLHELEQEMKKVGRYQPTPSAADTLEEHVRELADILRRTGDQVLRGDFSILFDRQRRHVNAVGKRR